MFEAVHRLLLASAERDEHKAVFLTSKGATSYGALRERAAAFAATLRELGVAPGERVAILLDGDVDYLVAFYGTLMAGAAALPLCPETRSESLVYALAHAEAVAVVLDAGGARLLCGLEGRVPSLQTVIARGPLGEPPALRVVDFAAATQHGERLYDAGASGDALAMLIYTSGTTGRPKGVMLSHQNLTANIRAVVSYLELSSRDVVGMVLPFYYVYGNSVLHTHVAAGGTIAHLGSLAFLGKVVGDLVQLGCTGLSGVPSTFSRLLSLASLGSYDLSRLRYVTQAGAAMSPALVERLQAALPHTRVFVMYGQTEGAGRLAYVPPERLRDKLGSAGKAIDGVRLSIRDAEGREVPRGTVGEVVAEGASVMLGYFRDPEASARVLEHGRLRTGDIGTMDEDGYLFLVGRDSELIKSGGHRIGPSEVEDAITRAAGVREAGVCGVADELLGEAIVAYVVADTDAQPTKRAILEACFESLPRFKHPTQIWLLSELPRTPTGKLTRRALRGYHAEQRGTRLT